MQTLLRKIDVDEHANKEDTIANHGYKCYFDPEVLIKLILSMMYHPLNDLRSQTNFIFSMIFSTFRFN